MNCTQPSVGRRERPSLGRDVRVVRAGETRQSRLNSLPLWSAGPCRTGDLIRDVVSTPLERFTVVLNCARDRSMFLVLHFPLRAPPRQLGEQAQKACSRVPHSREHSYESADREGMRTVVARAFKHSALGAHYQDGPFAFHRGDPVGGSARVSQSRRTVSTRERV